MSEKIHKFEIAGMGKAPFKVVGFFKMPSSSLLEQNPSAYNNIMAQLPKGFPVCTCSFCGMALMNNFLILSSDGVKSVVGSECVRKTDDKGLMDKAKYLKRQYDRKVRAEKEESQREARLQEEREQNGGLTVWEAEQKMLADRKADLDRKKQPAIDILSSLADRLEDKKGGFCDSIARGLRNGDLPNGRGYGIMIEILAKQAGRMNSKAFQAEEQEIVKAIEKAESLILKAYK